VKGEPRNPYPVQTALRRAGYQMIDRGLWVTPYERDLMIWAATKHMGQVQAVIAEVRRTNSNLE